MHRLGRSQLDITATSEKLTELSLEAVCLCTAGAHGYRPAIFVFNGQDFFGGDALTYDFFGTAQMLGWAGDKYYRGQGREVFTEGIGSGWGMVYLVGAIYGIVGRNMLAVQFVNSVFGAATAVVIFLCSHHVFKNIRVARIAGIAVAFYPSLVLWSAQGLKDGPIVFFWRSLFWRR